MIKIKEYGKDNKQKRKLSSYYDSTPLKFECHRFIAVVREVLYIIWQLKSLPQTPSDPTTLPVCLVPNIGCNQEGLVPEHEDTLPSYCKGCQEGCYVGTDLHRKLRSETGSRMVNDEMVEVGRVQEGASFHWSVGSNVFQDLFHP